MEQGRGACEYLVAGLLLVSRRAIPTRPYRLPVDAVHTTSRRTGTADGANMGALDRGELATRSGEDQGLRRHPSRGHVVLPGPWDEQYGKGAAAERSGELVWQLSRTDDGGQSWQLAAPAHRGTSLTISGTSSTKTCVVGVRAKNDAGYSNWGEINCGLILWRWMTTRIRVEACHATLPSLNRPTRQRSSRPSGRIGHRSVVSASEIIVI